MARGYPDFFGYSVFPCFGPTQTINVADFYAGGRQSIVSLSGKGIFLGATVYLKDRDVPPVAIFNLYIAVDGGTPLLVETFKLKDFEYGWHFPCLGHFVDWNYDIGRVTYSFVREINFGVSFEIQVDITGYVLDPAYDVRGFWDRII